MSLPVSKLPGPRGWPLLGLLPAYIRHSTNLHELEQRYSRQFGPIHQERLANNTFIVLSSPDLVEQLVRAEDSMPRRMPLVPWEAHRDLRSIPRGLVSSYGEEWARCRSVFSKPLLKPKEVNQYRTSINTSTDNLCRAMEADGTDALQLFRIWSLEIACSIMFGGNETWLTVPVPEATRDFLQRVDEIFEKGKPLFFLPRGVSKKLIEVGCWSKLMQAWDSVFETCKERLDQKLAQIESSSAESKESGFLDIAMANNQCPISKAEIYSCVSEIILGSIDQTATTLFLALAEIARNPRLQRDLLSEGRDDSQLMRATLKESFRMFPSMTRIPRLNQSEIVLGDYVIPPNSNVFIAAYALGRDEKYFPNPDTFDPYRWIGAEGRTSPYLIANFGFGSRMCIGKRLAALQLSIAINQIVKRYELHWRSEQPPRLHHPGLLTPADTSPLILYPRE